MDKNIEYYVLIKYKKIFGLNTISNMEGDYIADMYDVEMNLNAENDAEMFKDLLKGNLYDSVEDNPLNAINEVLKFWSISRIKVMPTIFDFNDIKTAIKYMKDEKKRYIVFKVLNLGGN